MAASKSPMEVRRGGEGEDAMHIMSYGRPKIVHDDKQVMTTTQRKIRSVLRPNLRVMNRAKEHLMKVSG